MGEKIFALDLGTASIGWAYLQHDLKDESGTIHGLGVRSFEEPIESKSKEPKNLKRRTARGLRRTTFRRASRKKLLLKILTENHLAPQTPAQEWLDLDPYALRAKALDQPLTLQELGRALYHLSQRRGFLSNRKTRGLDDTGIPEVDRLIALDEQAEIDRAAKKEKEGKTPKEATKADDDNEGTALKNIAALQAEIKAAQSPTIGAHFHTSLQNGQRVRGRHTLRQLFIDEFEAIWQAQTPHHPILTPSLKAQIYQALFFQRPLKIQDLRKPCRLEPDKKVTYRAHHLFQEFRIWSEIANIRLLFPDQNWAERPLTLDEKQKIAQELQSRTTTLGWKAFRKILKLKDSNYRINLESSFNYKKGLEPNATHRTLDNHTDEAWSKLSPEIQDQVMEILFNRDDDPAKVRNLIHQAKLPPELAYHIITTELPTGLASLSLRAIKKILPHLKAGHDLYNAKIAAGYTAEHEIDHGKNPTLQLVDIPTTLTNPSVKKAVFETRKLVNAVIRKYGKPDRIVVELARDLALNREDRARLIKSIKDNEKANKEAESEFKRHHPASTPSRTDKIKYRLWQEAEGVCLYTGRPIPLTELWTKSWEIEHIVPESISLDSSFNNLTLAPSEVNAKKGQRLPVEYFAQERPEAWHEARHRLAGCKSIRKHKKNLFLSTREDLEPEPGTKVNGKEKRSFVARQLEDTRYISRTVRDYLLTLGVKIDSASGALTAYLRHQWGLNSILNDSGAKTRDDHRHHAIDALVTALVTPAYVKRVAELHKADPTLQDPALVGKTQTPLPWPTLRQDAEAAVGQIIVSHEPAHRLRGPLHEETGYGTHHPSGQFVTRKALVDLKEGEILRIVDPSLRKQVLDALRKENIPVSLQDLAEAEDLDSEFDHDPDLPKEDLPQDDPLEENLPDGQPEAENTKSKARTAKWSKEQNEKARQILGNFAVTDRNGVQHPVKRAKIRAQKQDLKNYMKTPRGFFPYGNNQWLLVTEHKETKARDAIVVPLAKAVQVHRAGLTPESLVPVTHQLLFTLHKQDMVRLTDDPIIYRVQKFSAENPVDLFLSPHNAASDGFAIRLRSSKSLMLLNEPLKVGMLGPELPPKPK